MRCTDFTLVWIILLGHLVAPGSAPAGEWTWSKYRTLRKCCLPDHDYRSTVAPLTSPQSRRVEAIAVAATTPADQQRGRKSFHFRKLALKNDHLSMDQVGLAIYAAKGRIIANGRIAHSGGDGSLIGNNVTVRLRAYVAPMNANAARFTTVQAVTALGPELATTADPSVESPNDPTRIPPDSYAVWTSKREFWVPRGGPQFFSFVEEELQVSPKLSRYFDEITHLVLELEYKLDR